MFMDFCDGKNHDSNGLLTAVKFNNFGKLSFARMLSIAVVRVVINLIALEP